MLHVFYTSVIGIPLCIATPWDLLQHKHTIFIEKHLSKTCRTDHLSQKNLNPLQNFTKSIRIVCSDSIFVLLQEGMRSNDFTTTLTVFGLKPRSGSVVPFLFSRHKLSFFFNLCDGIAKAWQPGKAFSFQCNWAIRVVLMC